VADSRVSTHTEWPEAGHSVEEAAHLVEQAGTRELWVNRWTVGSDSERST